MMGDVMIYASQVLPSSGEIQSTIGIFSLADNEIMNE
jgi:hypothetical protein